MIRAGMFGNAVKTYGDPAYTSLVLAVLTLIGLLLMREGRKYVVIGMISAIDVTKEYRTEGRLHRALSNVSFSCGERGKAGGARPQRRRKIDTDPATRQGRAPDQRHDRTNHVVSWPLGAAGRLSGQFDRQ